MKHFSFVYFSMLLHDSEEGCSHFVLEGLTSLMVDGLWGTGFLSRLEKQNVPFVVSLFSIVELLRREES